MPLWGQAIVCLTLWGLYLFVESLGAGPVYLWPVGGILTFCILYLLKSIWDAWRWNRLVASMNVPTGIHGTAFEPTAEDAERFGLSFENPDGKGSLIAGKDGRLLFYCGDSHVTILGSNGAGKSASLLIPMGLSQNDNGVFTGKGTEVYLALRKYRGEVLGHEIRHWNPFNLGGLGGDSINLLEDLFSVVEAGDPLALSVAANKALLLIPIPKDGGGQNAYFFDFPRNFLGSALIYVVWKQVETGVPCGNLPYLNKVFSGSLDDLREFLFHMAECDAYEGTISRAAKLFLSLLKGEKGSSQAKSMLGMLANALAPFNPASHVGKAILHTDFDIQAITRKDMSLFVSIPPDQVQNFTPGGLLIEMLIGISLRDDSKDRCVLHFRLDEFGNLAGSKGEIPGIIPMLYLGRSLKTRGTFFAQDTGIFDRYHESSAFMTQAECYIATAVRDPEDAELLSKRAGQYSAIVESVNVPATGASGTDGSYTVNLPEQAIPNKRPDEILQMKPFTGLLFFKQFPPITIDLVHYQSVHEWREYAENNEDIELEDVPVLYSLKPRPWWLSALRRFV